nr:copia protein [Tanacetum cinerariifolium]
MAMQEELNQFKTNDVWELVLNPMDMIIIGTKWVYRNKLDENGVVTRNKARLVAQGYNQQEEIDYDETYAPVARLESIRILLAYACALDFKLYQMDMKSAFLNSFINEEVYVAQPSGFIDFVKPNYVYRLKKDLYGLKQAPKAWYDRLKAFLTKHDYSMGMVDNTLFTKKKDSNLIVVQIYVDDIIFGSTCQEMCDDFAKIMHDEFEISSLLYLTTSRPDIMFSVCLCARFQEDPKTSHLEAVKRIFRYIKGTTHFRLWYPRGSNIETIVYADLDHAGDYKQPALAISTTEVEYVSAGKACQQALWMKQALVDYGVRWPPRVTLGRLLPHASGLGFKPRRESFPSGAKKEWDLSPKAKVRVLHTAQVDVTCGVGLESKVMRECCFVVERDAWLRGVGSFDIGVDEFTLSSLDVLQGFSFFLQMGFTLILATLDGLDVGLLGDVIGEDDCDDDG